MLLVRYPDATTEELRKAHAYAYGGCIIQDIGYYPFGNHFFSDLVHYVRSGDFVMNMLKDSNNVDEYAFALGALSHYASDLAGHPFVNLAVADNFPRLETRFGHIVTYADNPKAHIQTEFGFDVVQVAKQRYTSDAYHDFIGFEVSKPLLEHAFADTYNLPIESVFPHLDLSIGSFRRCVSTLIPKMTRVALVMKKNEIVKEDPTMTRKRFLYHLKRSQYQQEWGRNYQRAGIGTRMMAFFLRIVPKVGPFRALDFKMPTASTENLYMKSVNDSMAAYAGDLHDEAAHSLHLDNKDFDTGHETIAGEYSLTDLAYSTLLNKLVENHFSALTPELRANILIFYRDPKPPAFAEKKPAKWTMTLSNLALLKALPDLQVVAR
jgi:hypothetical protein